MYWAKQATLTWNISYNQNGDAFVLAKWVCHNVSYDSAEWFIEWPLAYYPAYLERGEWGQTTVYLYATSIVATNEQANQMFEEKANSFFCLVLKV